MQNIITKLGFFFIKVHPLLFINLSLILGIITAYNNYSFGNFLIFFIFLFFKFLINMQNLKKEFIKNIILIIAFFFGIFIYNYQQNHFQNFKNLTNNKTFDLIGKIKDISIIEHLKLKNCLVFEVEKIKEKNSQNWQEVNKPVQLYVNKIYSLKVDDKLQIKDVKFNFAQNFSFENFLIKEKIFGSIYQYKFRYKFLNRPKYSIARSIHKWKTDLFFRLKSKMNENTFGLFSSIFLGNKNFVKKQMEDLKESFKIWGLSHYLARSGLHLVIIVSLWYLIMSLLQINFKLKNLVTFLLIIIYHFFSWPSIPFIRSLIMFILFKFCLFMDLQINALHFLNLTCLTVLIFNPMQLFFLDFQLSFALTYAIIWLSYINSFKYIRTHA